MFGWRVWSAKFARNNKKGATRSVLHDHEENYQKNHEEKDKSSNKNKKRKRNVNSIKSACCRIDNVANRR